MSNVGAFNSVEEILSRYKSIKFARPNRFEVTIVAGPLDMNSKRYLSLMAESTSFPGRNLKTSTYSAGYEASYELPDGMTYSNELDVVFLLTESHAEHDTFVAWQDLIYDDETHDIAYRHRYVGSLVIRQLNEHGEAVSVIRVNGCYPKTIDAIEVSNTATSEFSRLKVTFSFKDWETIT